MSGREFVRVGVQDGCDVRFPHLQEKGQRSSNRGEPRGGLGPRYQLHKVHT